MTEQDIAESARERARKAANYLPNWLRSLGIWLLYLIMSLLWVVLTVVLIQSESFISNFMGSDPLGTASVFQQFSTSVSSKGLLGIALLVDTVIITTLGQLAGRSHNGTGGSFSLPIMLTPIWGALCVVAMLACVMLVFIDGLGIAGATSQDSWTFFCLLFFILFVRFCTYYPRSPRSA